MEGYISPVISDSEFLLKCGEDYLQGRSGICRKRLQFQSGFRGKYGEYHSLLRFGRDRRFTSAVTQITEAELGSEAVKNALGADYWTISGNRIMPIISEGKVVTPIPMPTFADGDSASSVTKSFTLPLAYESEKGTEAITWSSSNPEIIAIDGADALVKGVIADAQVTLTAQTGSGKTKSITVTVVSNLVLEIDQEYEARDLHHCRCGKLSGGFGYKLPVGD